MYLRPKTTRRLLILCAAMLVITALAATMWGINKRKTAARIAKSRADAMAAFSKGDYASALPYFSDYLTASKTVEKAAGEADAEALLAYGKSRQAIPMPRGRHWIESIKIFERYLQLKPGDREAQHLLLDLYPRVRYNEEALNLARQVLESDPNDVPALRAKVVAFANQRKHKEALDVAEQLVRLLPNDLRAHSYVQTQMMKLERPSEEHPGQKVVERYEQLLRAHPDDPRFELLLGCAYHFANDSENARKWFVQASHRNTTDPEVATALSNMLERYNSFRESSAVLERLASADDDAMHVRPLVRRLWQSGRFKDVLKRTDDQDPASPTSDTDLLAYRALALYDMNRPADAAPIVEALAARKDDIDAVAWASAMQTRQNENLAPRERARQYQDILRDRAPDNEVVHFFLGETYASLGESEPALQAWHDAARLAPSWAAPAAAISRTLASTGRSAEALVAARVAFERAPNLLSTRTGYVLAAFADLQQDPDPTGRVKLLKIVEEIQAKVPREPETLSVYADLLSRTGQRDKAIAVIKSALNPDSPSPRDTLLALASVSFVEKLGLEGTVLDFAERQYGLGPQVAIRKAVLLAQAGKPKEGLKLMQAARDKDTKTDPTQWSLAIVQYRESINDDGVLAEWVRLGDTNTDNALIQSAILRSPLRFKDKAFWHRTIDRLRKLTGDEAVTPRVERARWLLTGDTTGKDASEAIVQLQAISRTELPEIHRLLGIAFEKSAAQNSGLQRDRLLANAAAELEKAYGARNADAAVATDLTRVFRAMGRTADADRVMANIAERASDLGVDGRKRTARTLINQGQLQKAVEVLEPIGDGQDVARDALLCGLYRRTGNAERAAALYRKVLADQRTEAATIAEGADFFASRGDKAEAERFVAKLRSMEMPESSRALLLARLAERQGKPDEALKSYEKAVTADATYPAAWLGLVGFQLRQLKFPEAVAAADRGLKALPDDAALQSLRARAMALQTYQKDANLDALAAELSNDPQSGAITDMMRILSDAKRTNEPINATLPKLRELADRNPDLLRLQMYVAQGYAKVGQYDQAEAVASRAALRAPNDAEAGRMLTAVYAARPGDEKWPRVLDAARQWRQRSLDNPLEADMMIARTLLEMRRPAEAADQLKAYVPAQLKPDTNAAVVETYALALLRAGDDRKAGALLLPIAKDSPAWRKLWLNLGVNGFDRADNAVRWIEQIVPSVSKTAVDERVALAEAWCAIGARFATPAAFDKARPLVDALTTDPKGAADGWRLLAQLSESTNDMIGAAKAYRKLIEIQPDNADVKNNLAYALLEQGKTDDLPEARKLAEAAVAKSPTNSTYLDTLARIHLKARDLPAAEQTFQRAIDAQQNSVEAMIGLADVHVQAGRRDKAKDLLARINNALPPGTILPPTLQKQLDNVRQSVKIPIQSGRIE